MLGLDLQECELALPAHASTLVADAFTMSVEELHGPFDVVLSDMAPKTSGQRHADQYRSFELYCRALELACKVLRPGGSFVGKIFQGAEFEEARERTRQHFSKVRVIRPEATRDESYELFLVGLDLVEASD